ncbi:ShlB/FhaC/HecB family hemolysin secretion/activation protein [Erythrobacter sp. JK5]|uniref:ShlB/FhaC/HecB family hemolysin secretion/activation protein n=1 Tax=Erythrobacter sp. JK5 TaxID=2829500 RepID=UPI001BA4FA23|nr:ShlB/FhaC/HecB family hemolysin secretion/activation protein [Erythrobacter sp. JK5]QUL36767.1 ShlB/FhaC/HecB family hemolysin secretion/activation protein [Erythrobacter sp. JK5]
MVAPAHALQAAQADGPPRIAFSDVLAVQPEGSYDRGSAPQADQIGAVVVRGNEAIEDARYQEVVERFFGEPLNQEVLERLNDELAQLAREQGYPYARTTIDEDAAALGMIEVIVDEGRIDAIAIEGAENAQARRMLEGLVGRPARREELESVLLRISDIPGLSLRGARLRREGDQSTLAVKLEQRPHEARLAADNYGTRSFGPVRASASTALFGVLTASDAIRTSVRVNPVDFDELLFASSSYETQISDSGITAQIGGALGETAPGGALNGSDINGDTLRGFATVTAPLKRSKQSSLWVDTEFAFISIEQDDLGALLRDDTIVSASVGLRTRFAIAGGGFVRTGVSLERGLGIFGATRLGDPSASRGDGDGVYTKFRFNADTRVPLTKRLDLYLSAAGQLADRPLLASEELSLGGAYRVRGYDFAEVLGDEGIYGLAELRYRVNTDDLPFDFLQFYSFIDGGYVSDIDQTGGEGSLFSAGPGVRARIGLLDFEVEGAFPLGGSGESSDPDGPEINVRAGVSF